MSVYSDALYVMTVVVLIWFFYRMLVADKPLVPHVHLASSEEKSRYVIEQTCRCGAQRTVPTRRGYKTAQTGWGPPSEPPAQFNPDESEIHQYRYGGGTAITQAVRNPFAPIEDLVEIVEKMVTIEFETDLRKREWRERDVLGSLIETAELEQVPVSILLERVENGTLDADRLLSMFQKGLQESGERVPLGVRYEVIKGKGHVRREVRVMDPDTDEYLGSVEVCSCGECPTKTRTTGEGD